jgi:hypothetical protein
VITDLKAGSFLTTVRDTLRRIPSAESFQESHFGEIVAGLFAEEISELCRLYSKLSLLTAENSNAFKMDLVLCNLKKIPLEFVFAEVKSSPKSADEGLPAGHDKSCFPSLFESFNKYDSVDLEFDLTAARDNLAIMDPGEAKRIHDALLPYGSRTIKYAGFVVIDSATHSEEEAALLATRKNSTEFEVDLICIESLKLNMDSAFAELKRFCS